MGFTVEFDHAPAYELLASLESYRKPAATRVLDLGAGWRRRVREQLDPRLAARLDRLSGSFAIPPYILVWLCPGTRSATAFLRWLAGLTAGELYAALEPFLPVDGPTLPPLTRLRDDWTELVDAWNRQYFDRLDPALLEALSKEARDRAGDLAGRDAAEVVDTVTGGLRLDGCQGLERVVLVPQLHLRPFNSYDVWRKLVLVLYPADAPQAAGAPPARLLRLGRALSDASRLRILRDLARGPCGLAEIARRSGLGKSTVHHHLAVLRAAGLVSFSLQGGRYSLRTTVIEELPALVRQFLADGDGRPDHGCGRPPNGALKALPAGRLPRRPSSR